MEERSKKNALDFNGQMMLSQLKLHEAFIIKVSPHSTATTHAGKETEKEGIVRSFHSSISRGKYVSVCIVDLDLDLNFVDRYIWRLFCFIFLFYGTLAIGVGTPPLVGEGSKLGVR